MDETATPLRKRAFRRTWRGPRPDYKEKLARQTAWSSSAYAEEGSATEPSSSLIRLIEALAQGEEVAQASFQSVAMTVLQTLERVVGCERCTVQAALSLAQRQQLLHMIEEGEAAIRLLRGLLGPRQAALLDRNTATASGVQAGASWWYALCEALHIVETERARIASLITGRPRSYSASALCHGVLVCLQRHERILFAEAEQWMS